MEHDILHLGLGGEHTTLKKEENLNPSVDVERRKFLNNFCELRGCLTISFLHNFLFFAFLKVSETFLQH